jgi:hypothetical protein
MNKIPGCEKTKQFCQNFYLFIKCVRCDDVLCVKEREKEEKKTTKGSKKTATDLPVGE